MGLSATRTLANILSSALLVSLEATLNEVTLTLSCQFIPLEHIRTCILDEVFDH